MKRFNLLLVNLCFLICSYSFAGDCKTDIEASAPTSRYSYKDAIVTDNVTKLTWTRCVLGKEWINGACSGTAKTVTWDEANKIVSEINQNGTKGQQNWRLPSLPELASIVERQCFYPRVNEEIFPGTPSELFLSGSRRKGTSSEIFALDFGSGNTLVKSMDSSGLVRLVRGAPWWTPPKSQATQKLEAEDAAYFKSGNTPTNLH